MEKRNNYQNTEEKTFRNNFGKFKDKKIVLYGIGRFTATLLPCVTDFKIIGLMDRDNANIGKKSMAFRYWEKRKSGKKQISSLLIHPQITGR